MRTSNALPAWRIARSRRADLPEIDSLAQSARMHWDVIEVRAEPGHRLFVRFADGTNGKVELALSELSGVLAPLRDPSFFERVFVDDGAVAWPGDIDLAPDAMYQQVVE